MVPGQSLREMANLVPHLSENDKIGPLKKISRKFKHGPLRIQKSQFIPWINIWRFTVLVPMILQITTLNLKPNFINLPSPNSLN